MSQSQRYFLRKKIGEGGFGKVYMGYDSKLDITVCIKKLDYTFENKFRADNELQILKSLNHPNIVKYLDHYQFEEKFYIVMELLKGGDLKQFIEEYKQQCKSIPEILILKIFSQLVSALKYLVEKKIIHRDIKPGNILYSKVGIVKLADFGLAKILPDRQIELEHGSSSIGSIDYCSPEVVQGDFFFIFSRYLESWCCCLSNDDFRTSIS